MAISQFPALEMEYKCSGLETGLASSENFDAAFWDLLSKMKESV